jgi:hypothetical protein
MEKLIKKILKEELQGQEFIDNYYKELERFESTKDDIINYIKSQYPNLVDVEYKTRKVMLASIILGNEAAKVDRTSIILKFTDLTKKEVGMYSQPIRNDITNIFTNYFGFDVLGYGSPIEVIYMGQIWVTF